MAENKRGARSFQLQKPPVITAWASIAGKKEGQGPLCACFDYAADDTLFGQKSWEQAECRLQELALEVLLKKAQKKEKDIDVVFSGDLLNQCISSSFALRNKKLPVLGLYGACSTMAEGLLVASMAVSGGFAERAVAMTSSHFASSERQFRFPLGYGGQRTPTAQWTATGAGAVMVSSRGKGAVIDAATMGTVRDLGITDANNMGAAMAPAAVETLTQHWEDLHRSPEDYDLIVTGDLGAVGAEIVSQELQSMGFNLGNRYNDCGLMLFDRKKQDVHAGGSGCGCSALVLCGQLLDKMKKGELRRLLFCGTGALLSPTSTQQGQTIPGICHAVSIKAQEE